MEPKTISTSSLPDEGRPRGAPESDCRSRRLQAAALAWVGCGLVWSIGTSLRFRVEGWEHFQRLKDRSQPLIFSFWHNQILAATYFWRRRNIVVITSQNFDGEYIARIIRRFGYGAARGSSSRGAVRALLELKRCLGRGVDVAFTIDGPRGPVYQVKSGPLWLSQRTGAPILPFHIEPERFWRLRSWDGFRIPRPFSRVLVKIGKPLLVPAEADEESWLALYQEAMDRLKDYCEGFWNPTGTPRRSLVEP